MGKDSSAQYLLDGQHQMLRDQLSEECACSFDRGSCCNSEPACFSALELVHATESGAVQLLMSPAYLTGISQLAHNHAVLVFSDGRQQRVSVLVAQEGAGRNDPHWLHLAQQILENSKQRYNSKGTHAAAIASKQNSGDWVVEWVHEDSSSQAVSKYSRSRNSHRHKTSRDFLLGLTGAHLPQLAVGLLGAVAAACVTAVAPTRRDAGQRHSKQGRASPQLLFG